MAKEALKPESGALKLYELLYGKAEQPAPAAPLNVREPVTGATKPPLPYRFPLIGVAPLAQAPPVAEAKAARPQAPVIADAIAPAMLTPEEPASLPDPTTAAAAEPRDKWNKAVRVCRGCRDLRPIIARGLCAKCYWHEPDVKEKRSARRSEAVEASGAWPAFTPEIDKQISAVYREEVGIASSRAASPVRDLAKKLGMPRWRVSKRAHALGLTTRAPVGKKEPPWCAEEKEILLANAGLVPSSIQRKLKSAGYFRTAFAIILMRRRLIGKAPKNGYSASALARRFGVDNKAVGGWIRAGRLVAQPRGTARLSSQGGDEHMISAESVRRFIIGNVEVIDFRKLDKFWLVEILAGREAGRVD